MGRGNRADGAHRRQPSRKYRSGVRSLEDRITLSATPGSGDVDDLLTPGDEHHSTQITTQATGAAESSGATATAAWYSSVSSAWFTTLSTSSLTGGAGAVQTTDGSTGTTGGVNDPTVDPANYSEWIVRLSAAALQTIDSVDEAAAWLSTPSLGLSVIAGLGLPGQLLVRATGAIADVERFFAENDSLAYYESNREVNVQATPNDSSYSSLYGLHNTGQTGGTVDADIDAPEAWDISTGSRSIVVGVIDTGIDWTHPDLAANIWTNPGEIAGDGIDNDANGFIDDVHGYDFVNNDGNPMDDHYHGTHVAGTIGGVGNNGSGVVGVNWAVSMMGLKFLSASGSGTTANAVRAVNYATMMRTTHGVNIRMTSNSWGGGGFDQGLLDAINAGGAADILFVAAAGNNGANADLSPHYPSSYNSQYIVSVAATDHNDALASFSNYGATSVDLAAPGVNTYSTSPGNSYRSLSGTSMATPHVSGVAALALSVDPTLTALQLKSKLLENVDVIPSLAGKTLTGGRLNAYKVLSSLGLTVAGTTPAIDSSVSVPPTSFTVNFNHAYDASTVQAADFSVNGTAASGFAIVDADTITFTFATSPVTAQGVQTMAMTEGAITRASDGDTLAPFSGTFRYDVVPLAVAATTPVQGALVSLPLTTLDVTFNEAIDGASLGVGDLTVSQGSVTGATLLNATTARYTLSGLAAEGTFNFTLTAGAVTDTFGNGGAAYSGSFSLDIGTVAFPAVAAVGLAGSLAYQTTFTGSVGAVGDEDRLTIAIDAGQHLTVQLDAGAGLTAVIEVRDPSDTLVGTATAAGAGLDAVLQNLSIGADGTYTIVVRGAASSTGTYTVRAVLNSAVESENHNGPTNGTLATAQALDGALVTLSGSAARASVLGRRTSSSDADWYALSLASGQTVSAMLRLIGTGTPGLRLIDAAGTSLAMGTNNTASGTFDIYGFTATAAGTYYLEVSGSTSYDYQLIVGRNAEFDRAGNIATASAQSLAGASGTLLGNLDGGASIGRLYVYDNATSRIREINKTTGAAISTFVSPVTTSGGPDFGLATTPTSILVGGNNTSPVYELDPNTGAVLRTIGASGISISGLAYRNGEIFIRTDSSNTITVRDYLTGNTLRTFTIASSLESLSAASDYLYASSGMLLYSIDPQTGATVSSRTLSGSGTIEGLGVIGNELYAGLGSTIQVYDRTTFTLLRTITGQGDLEAIGADGGTTSTGDFYRISLDAGVAFQARTNTPGDGAGEFVNLLDARLSLYDAVGNLVASDDNSAADGRNALLNYTPASGGTYYLVVEPSAPANQTTSRGEYVLEYSGAAAAAAPFAVAAVTPADGSNVIGGGVSQVTLVFNDGVLLSSLAASDLTVDGVAATSFTVVDGSTIRFNLAAPITIGTHTVALAAGAVVDLQQTPVAAFSSTFSVDAAAPRVIASSIQQNDVLGAGGLTYTVTFDEVMRTANLDASDFTLRGNFRSVDYTATGFAYDAAGTTLTITYAALPEDSYTLTLLSGDGRFEDATGNDLDGEAMFPLPPNRSGNGTAGGNFVVTFSSDGAATALAAPTAVAPAGSLVYQSAAPQTVVIGATGDVDELTIELDAGQTLSVVATPSAALRTTLEILGPGGASLGTTTAPVAGQTLVVQTLPIAVAGTYRLRLSGAGNTTGMASVSITLNAALEDESNGGAGNSTIATAQSLETSFLTLAGGGSRGAVIGKLDGAGSGSATLTYVDSGWYDIAGTHTATNTNYVAGIGSTGEVHNFFVFNLSTITGQIVSAQLRLTNPSGGYSSADPTETYGLFDVSTSISQLTAGGSGLTAIFNDLGTGTAFGSRTVSTADSGQLVTIDLNAAGLAMLNAGRGGQIALGGSLTTLSGTAMQYIFGFTGSGTRELAITYGDPLPDYYSLALSAGEAATIGLKHLAGSGATISILDAAGNVLASGVSGSGTFDQVVEGFTAPAGGNYYVAVASTTQTTYDLVVTRSLALDNGANASAASAQTVGPVGGVLGYASAGAGDYYSIAVAAAATLTLSTATPGDGPGQFANGLDPALELYDAAGNLVASNTGGGADGRNALVTYAAAAGTYKVRVIATSGQGEYVLQIGGGSVSTPPSISPIGAATTDEDRPVSIEFTVTDPDTPADQISVTATAADGSLVPPANLNATHLGDGLWRVTVTPAADRSGATTILVRASDGGTTTSRSFTLSVAPVNDTPSFVKGADLSVDRLAGAQTVAAWATAISPGPNEAGQALSFLIANDNPALFSAPPTIAANGTLTFTPSGVLGTAVVTVRLRDDGGTFGGGVDTSAPQTFTITVNNATVAPGGLDLSFDGDGVRMLQSTLGSADVGRDVARQSDGKYLVLSTILRGGASSSTGTSALTRYNADGSLDAAFGVGGSVKFAELVRATGIEIRSDGKILVGGYVSGSAYSARLNTDGTFDTTYGQSNGIAMISLGLSSWTSGEPTATALQADGKLIVMRGNNSQTILARFNENGTADTTFNGTGYVKFTVPSTTSNSPKDVAIQSSGKIVVVGNLTSGNQELFAARFNADGTIDTGFGPSGTGAIVISLSTSTDTAARLVVLSDDKLLIAGNNNTDFGLVRLTAAGLLDTSFSGDGMLTTNLGGTDVAGALTIQADGKIVLGGSSSVSSNLDFAVARYLTDGTLDTSFDGDGMKKFAVGAINDNMLGLGSDPDGKLIFTGLSSDATDGGESVVGRLLADGALDTSFNGTGTNKTGFGPASALATKTLVLSDGRILVGGDLTDSSSVSRSVVWRLTTTGALDTTFGTGGYWINSPTSFTNGVRGLTVDAQGRILIIEQSGGRVTRLTADGVTDTTFTTASFSSSIGTAAALAVQADGAVVVVGTRSSDITAGRLTSTGAFDTSFDGDGWMAVDLAGSFDTGTSVAIDAAGKIVVGGYGTISGPDDFAVLRLNTDGSFDTSFSGDGRFTQTVASGVTDRVRDLLIAPDGKIVAAGYSSGNFALMRILADGTLDTSFSADGIVSHSPTTGIDELHSVALQADGKLYAAGYGSINGVGQMVVARYLADGSLDTTLDNGDGILLTPVGAITSQAKASALQADGKLVVVGHADVGPIHQAAALRYRPGSVLVESPSVTPIADRIVRTGVAGGAIDFTVSHTSLPPGSLSVMVTSGNQTVVPNENLSLVNLGGGQWRLVVTPTDTAGTALITVQVNDGSLIYAETFTLTVVPPATVTGVYARGSGWNASFLDYVDSHALGHATIAGLGYRITAESQLQTLPWSNVDTITLEFDGPVVVGLNDLTLVGSTSAAPPPAATGFVWNATNFTATWTFTAALGMNKYLLHLDPAVFISADGGEAPAAVAPFDFRFNMLPGDADASAGVTFAEIGQMRNMIGHTAASAGYNPRQDWDGSGSVTFADVGLARQQLGTGLGSLVDPVAPPSTGSIDSPGAEAVAGASAAVGETSILDLVAAETTASVTAALGTTTFAVEEFVSLPADVAIETATVMIAAEGSRRAPAVVDLLRPSPATPVVTPFSLSTVRRLVARSSDLVTPTITEDWSAHLRHLTADLGVEGPVIGRGGSPVVARPTAWQRLRRTQVSTTVASEFEADESTDAGE